MNGTTGATPSRAAACAKHFIGYSDPSDGHDRSPAWIPTQHLYQYFVPPWRRAIKEAGLISVMESYSETDGVPMVANSNSLNYLLRQRLNFMGVLLTDFAEILNFHSWHHVVETDAAAVAYTLSQGSIDMSMIAWDASSFSMCVLQGLKSKAYTEGRICESARRVLQLKQDLLMFDEVLTMEDPNLALVGTDEALALDMVRQSIILTKNVDKLLPLQSNSTQLKILITGPIYRAGTDEYSSAA